MKRADYFQILDLREALKCQTQIPGRALMLNTAIVKKILDCQQSLFGLWRRRESESLRCDQQQSS